MQRFATVAVVGAMLGVVGTVAAVQAFQPTEKPASTRVQLVQPAGETVTPSATSTTATPTVTVTVAPKPAPVESSEAPAPAPKVVQKKVIVAETPASEPSPSQTSEATQAPAVPGTPPPVRWGSNDKPPAPPTSAK